MSAVAFTKMAGAGNDFLVIDTRVRRTPIPAAEGRAMSRSLCDRRHGVGADGLLLLERSRRADVRMRILNPDGSEAEMCGNGARCVAWYVSHAGSRRRAQRRAARTVTIETKAGILSARVRGDRVALRMTDPTKLQLGLSLDVGRRRIPLAFVNTGVPHVVVPVDRIDEVDVNQLGRALRYHPRFSPHGANVNFMQEDGTRPDYLRVRTFERGVEGETLACGTGVAASALIHALRRPGKGAGRERGNGHASRTQRVTVEARSGDQLTVSFRVSGIGASRRVSDMVLEGPARQIFEGAIRRPREGTGWR